MALMNKLVKSYFSQMTRIDLVYYNVHMPKGCVSLNRDVCNFMILPIDLESYDFDFVCHCLISTKSSIHSIEIETSSKQVVFSI